ncbi:hypothetical protein PsorP6_004502 [Peronosclerospora sorghi]|uniref:Uncharacterized protein n=1 Tax=Peronosclerospora sorghi TaxID=230839 RepID=A0ACC0VL14_9STRA|nr:hypothetical protein PsorP6_004502 [Peronosclerospora sorghi]
MHSFMGRHGFSLGGGKGSKERTSRDAHEEADGKPKFAPETSVISTPDYLKAAVAGVPPENVYWLHETRLFYAMSPDRQALPSNHHPDKKLTMLLALNADGSDRLNPFVVGPHPLPANPSADGEEKPYQFACNHKAWMPPTMLRDWLMALDWRMRVTNRQIVLIVDSVAAMCVQKISLSNVTMHFVERNHAGELCVRALEMGIVAAVKRRYRHQLLDYALDRREEGQLDIYDIPLQKVVNWVVQGWQQIPQSRIMASFARVGVIFTNENGATIIPDDRTDDKLDAQIQVLLKRLKLVSPMRLIEVVAPSSEKVFDDNLTDADFADSALHAKHRTVGLQLSSSEDLTRHTFMQELPTDNSSGGSLTSSFDAQAATSRPTSSHRNNNSSTTANNFMGDYSGFDQGYPSSLDDTWLTWNISNRVVAPPLRHSGSDLEAVQTTIRLATEMSCDPVVLLELNRIHTELANRDPGASSSAMSTRNTRICQFRFGAPTRRLL